LRKWALVNFDLELQQRDLKRTPRAAAIILNQFFDRWPGASGITGTLRLKSSR